MAEKEEERVLLAVAAIWRGWLRGVAVCGVAGRGRLSKRHARSGAWYATEREGVAAWRRGLVGRGKQRSAGRWTTAGCNKRGAARVVFFLKMWSLLPANGCLGED